MNGKSEFIEKFLNKHQPLLNGVFFGKKESKMSGTSYNLELGKYRIKDFLSSPYIFFENKNFRYDIKVYLFLSFVIHNLG